MNHNKIQQIANRAYVVLCSINQDNFMDWKYFHQMYLSHVLSRIFGYRMMTSEHGNTVPSTNMISYWLDLTSNWTNSWVTYLWHKKPWCPWSCHIIMMTPESDTFYTECFVLSCAIAVVSIHSYHFITVILKYVFIKPNSIFPRHYKLHLEYLHSHSHNYGKLSALNWS